MSISDEAKIRKIYSENLRTAKQKLAEVPVCAGNDPDFTGLRGWIYEQSIQFCIKRELNSENITADIEEQFKLEGRVRTHIQAKRGCNPVRTNDSFLVSRRNGASSIYGDNV